MDSASNGTFTIKSVGAHTVTTDAAGATETFGVTRDMNVAVGDKVVYDCDKKTTTWTIAGGAFTSADKGKLLTINGTNTGEDGVYTVKSVVDATDIVSVEPTPFLGALNCDPTKTGLTGEDDFVAATKAVLGPVSVAYGVAYTISVHSTITDTFGVQMGTAAAANAKVTFSTF
jgi:hypothetical protein